MIETWQNCVAGAALAVGAAIAGVAVAWIVRRAWGILRRALTRRELAVFLALAAVATWAAQKRLVRFPRTDPAIAYLTDAGSYVDDETDIVHIDFRRVIVPDTARVYVDRAARGVEPPEWVHEVATTFAAMELPYEFHHAGATNYDWIVYTDWTPGPTVVTNGVWHANWGRDVRTRRHVIPVRTAVRVDGETIATPKSKEDAQ